MYKDIASPLRRLSDLCALKNLGGRRDSSCLDLVGKIPTWSEGIVATLVRSSLDGIG